MLFNGISEFESKFKMFDRLNSLLFNVWRDKNAIAYKDSDIARITNEYRKYTSKVRSLSEEVNRLERQLNEKFVEIEHIENDLSNIALNPQINGCNIYKAYGETTTYNEEGTPRTQRSKDVRFVAKSGNEKAMAAGMVGNCSKLYVTLEKNL